MPCQTLFSGLVKGIIIINILAIMPAVGHMAIRALNTFIQMSVLVGYLLPRAPLYLAS